MSDDQFHDDDKIDFEDASGEGGFEDFEGGGSTLGDMWRNNPLVKIGIIAGGLITIIGVIVLFGGKSTPISPSRVSGRGDVSEAPGQGPVSEEYKKAVEEGNVQRTEEAVRTGTSAIPTPIDTPVSRLQLPDEKKETEDPLERWRRIQEERQRQAAQKGPEQVTLNPHAEAINALAQAMSEQMQGVLEKRAPLRPVNKQVADEGYLDELKEKQDGKSGASGTANTDGTQDVVNILVPAGDIEYAQLVLEANSDVDGSPVLAYLASGPLSGSKLLGKFEVKDEYLVLTFNTIVTDGIAQSINAVALDPDTTLPALATDVDHHYLTRIILPAAAAFISGFSGAVGDSGSTTVTVDGGAAVESSLAKDSRQEIFKGLEEAGNKISEIIDDKAKNTDPTVKVAAGTPMGILFLEPVTDENN